MPPLGVLIGWLGSIPGSDWVGLTYTGVELRQKRLMPRNSASKQRVISKVLVVL